MASKFAISAELLAYVLDLPEGARIGCIDRVPLGDGKVQFIVSVTDVDWPEGKVNLHYEQGDDGIVSLTGVSPVENEE